MLFIFALLLAASSASMHDNQGRIKREAITNCRPGYTPSADNTKCYKLNSVAKPRVAAKIGCQRENAYLARPQSEEEAAHLSDMLREQPLVASNIPFYMRYALIDYVLVSDKLWRDSTHRNLNNSIPWAPGEPNSADGMEICLTIDRQGQLNDYYCNKPVVYFCEYQM